MLLQDSRRAARARLRLRRGFSTLSADDVARVLQPIAEAGTDTTPEAVAPTLVALRDEFSTRLATAERQTEEILDELLSRGKERIIRVEAKIVGREIASPEELAALIREIEERIASQLKPGVRVRIV